MRMIWLILQALIITALTVGALWVYTRATAPVPGDCRVRYVYDGDTIAMDCGAGEVTARLQGLNAPETRDAACDAERQAGKRATDRLRALVKTGRNRIALMGQDKYGRTLIRLWINDEDAAAILVREGLAEPYLGGQRRNWCAG